MVCHTALICFSLENLFLLAVELDIVIFLSGAMLLSVVLIESFYFVKYCLLNTDCINNYHLFECLLNFGYMSLLCSGNF